MKQSRKNVIYGELGKFLIDVSKLVFGGVILAGIMEYDDINPAMLFGIGGIAMVLTFIVGIMYLVLAKKEEE